MSTRLREAVHTEVLQQGGPPTGAGNALDALRRAGQEMLRAGDEAINRALSKGNSESFLAANKQQGGQ